MTQDTASGRIASRPGSRASTEPVPVSAAGAASIPCAVRDRLPWEGGKCRVPMWMNGCPSGFCDAEAFGEQLPREILERERGYGRYNRVPYCFGPCCPAHGGPLQDEPRFFTDGLTERGYRMWCCVGPDFENLQESPAGFDGDPFRARANFLAASRIEAHSDETPQEVRPEGREPDGEAGTPAPDSPTQTDGEGK